VVVAHSLGNLFETATAHPPGDTDSLVIFGRTLPPDSYFDRYSYEERILILLAGRFADERQGSFSPLSFGGGAEDDLQALTLAAMSAKRDPETTAATLTAAKSKARRLVHDGWSSILQVAAELEERDLGTDDMVRILGPAPPLTFVERTATGYVGRGERLDQAVVLAGVAALLDGTPYGIAHMQLVDGREALAWKNQRGELAVTFDGITEVLR
jgi:hypothetical protein